MISLRLNFCCVFLGLLSFSLAPSLAMADCADAVSGISENSSSRQVLLRGRIPIEVRADDSATAAVLESNEHIVSSLQSLVVAPNRILDLLYFQLLGHQDMDPRSKARITIRVFPQSEVDRNSGLMSFDALLEQSSSGFQDQEKTTQGAQNFWTFRWSVRPVPAVIKSVTKRRTGRDEGEFFGALDSAILADGNSHFGMPVNETEEP